MYKLSSKPQQTSLFWNLETMLDFKHPLFKLANLVDWAMCEKSFSPLYCQDNGRPAKPIRLMAGIEPVIGHFKSDHRLGAKSIKNIKLIDLQQKSIFILR